MPARAERIGHAHLVAPAAGLRAAGFCELADHLQQEAAAWCDLLLRHRRSPAYKIVLRDPSAVPADRLFDALRQTADTLRGHGDVVGHGAWAVALAARLGAWLDVCGCSDGPVVVCIDTAPDGTGELVAFPRETWDRPDALAAR